MMAPVDTKNVFIEETLKNIANLNRSTRKKYVSEKQFK